LISSLISGHEKTSSSFEEVDQVIGGQAGSR
jgi:hypothetical protein